MEETQEIWKPIKGYEGLYEVSNLGNVRSCPRIYTDSRGWVYHKKGQTLKYLLRNHYNSVALCKNNKSAQKTVHRLVATAFIPNPNNLPQINHKDENKLNNHVDNLEWCTAEYNNNYGTGNIRRAISKGKRVRCIETGEEFFSIGEAGRRLKIQGGNIWKVIIGERNKAGGLHFEYVD